MARKANRPSDANYNARRRYLRSAKKYMGKAENAIGAEKERYLAMARDLTEKAAELYQRKANIDRSSNFETLSETFQINVNEFMQSEKPTRRDIKHSEKLREESKDLVRPDNMTKPEWENLQREREAQVILNTKAGSRIYAGLVDLWTDDVETGDGIARKKNVSDINAAITGYFGFDSMMDVIEFLEAQIGENLFALPESILKYDEITTALAQLASNRNG